MYMLICWTCQTCIMEYDKAEVLGSYKLHKGNAPDHAMQIFDLDKLDVSQYHINKDMFANPRVRNSIGRVPAS